MYADAFRRNFRGFSRWLRRAPDAIAGAKPDQEDACWTWRLKLALESQSDARINAALCTPLPHSIWSVTLVEHELVIIPERIFTLELFQNLPRHNRGLVIRYMQRCAINIPPVVFHFLLHLDATACPTDVTDQSPQPFIVWWFFHNRYARLAVAHLPRFHEAMVQTRWLMRKLKAFEESSVDGVLDMIREWKKRPISHIDYLLPVPLVPDGTMCMLFRLAALYNQNVHYNDPHALHWWVRSPVAVLENNFDYVRCFPSLCVALLRLTETDRVHSNVRALVFARAMLDHGRLTEALGRVFTDWYAKMCRSDWLFPTHIMCEGVAAEVFHREHVGARYFWAPFIV
jgi:hypothetical protein